MGMRVQGKQSGWNGQSQRRKKCGESELQKCLENLLRVAQPAQGRRQPGQKTLRGRIEEAVLGAHTVSDSLEKDSVY